MQMRGGKTEKSEQLRFANFIEFIFIILVHPNKIIAYPPLLDIS